ncbi:probable E3 ubiquitin-protein ligase RHG1A isoform X2 [Ziziphus jujuba]|uniref:RING-type E3 ubiquitin transferase n=1 Tax=Ziziphus jujuba TaxID=326968 RepID=A0ABM3IN46_ZIZJJ|nr:probable E3 ubiquitin-protein ligase RHG1A isoform X2 [Ziziphus jujuba]
MQGQRGTIGSLPETLDFDHGATSNNAALDQQICWNNLRNPADNRMPDYMLSPSDMNITLVNSMSRERQSRRCLGEPSSSNTQNEVSLDERKTELGWSSSISPCAVSGPRLEERRCAPTSNLSLDNNSNHVFTQSSSSDAIPQNLNLNASFVGHSSENTQVMECPNSFKCVVSENEQIHPASGSDPFLLPSRGAGFLVGENDGRPGCSLEGRRASCKRKAIEGNVGQSSVSGSCSYYQHAESSARPGVPTRYNAGSGLSVSASSEQWNPILGLGGREVTSDNLPDSSVSGSSESSHRNFRVRTNPSNQQNSISPSIFSTGRTVRHSSVMSSQLSPSLLPVDHNMDLRPAPAVDSMSAQSQPPAIHVPPLPQNMQSLRWSGGSSSRTGNSSSSMVHGDRDAPAREELSSRSLARNMLDHSIFVPVTELRNLVRHPAGRTLTGGNISIPGNVPPASRPSSSSSAHPSPAPAWVPHHNSPPQYPRRISEYVRRTLFSSAGTESGSQSSSYLPMRSGHPASSQEMVLPSGAGNQGYHQAHPRSASWMERQNDGGLGIHYSLRSLAAGGEGSNRIVSEDVMILDQSVFFGVADIHDRHRDMRLDVDNMSYEELLALEERIGNVSTGLSEETIRNRLKQKKYSVAVVSQLEAEPCCICQEDYNEGEDLGTLECGHDFHSDCIKQWLMHKNLCPICKTTALAT